MLRDLGGAEREVNGMRFLAGKEVGEGAVVEDVEGRGGEDVLQDASGLVLAVVWSPVGMPRVEVSEDEGGWREHRKESFEVVDLLRLSYS